jgi:hypothetical protein
MGSSEAARLIELHTLGEAPWSRQVEWVAEIIERFPGSIVTCDATGVGDPITEELQRRVRHATLRRFVFTRTTKPALIDQLVWMLDNRRLLMTPFPDLLREMQHFQMSTTDSGHAQLGAASGYHDDRVCALALALHELPVGSGATILAGGTRMFQFNQEVLDVQTIPA